MSSVIIVLALLAFGGLAAYIGDVLGYRLGKRRLSLLRLRPRTTARLVGILAGILVPGVTMLIGAAVSPTVRAALLDFDDIRRELISLRGERGTLTSQRDSMRDEVTRLRDAVGNARTETDETLGELADTVTQLDAAQEAVSVAEREVGNLSAQTGTLERDLSTVSSSLKEASEAVKQAGKELRKVEEDRLAAETGRDAAEIQAETLRGSVDALGEQITSLDEEIAGLDEVYQDKLAELAGKTPIVELRTELVRGVVTRHDDPDTLTNAVVALMIAADQAAEASGAAEGSNGRAVRIVGPRPVRTDDTDEDVSESKIIAQIVRLLWKGTNDSNVVRVVVARRAYAGEQVDVWFNLMPNELLFDEGETLVMRTIEPDLDEIDVLEQIWLLIAHPKRSEVRKQAQEAGMLPNPETGGYGVMPIREMYRAAQRCANSDEPVRILLQADEDAYTVGPLSIRIVVVPSES